MGGFTGSRGPRKRATKHVDASRSPAELVAPHHGRLPMTQQTTGGSHLSNPKADFLDPGERPTTMMAAVIDATGGPEVLHLAEVPLPIRINAEVLVKVAGAGLNPLDAKPP